MFISKSEDYVLEEAYEIFNTLYKGAQQNSLKETSNVLKSKQPKHFSYQKFEKLISNNKYKKELNSILNELFSNVIINTPGIEDNIKRCFEFTERITDNLVVIISFLIKEKEYIVLVKYITLIETLLDFLKLCEEKTIQNKENIKVISKNLISVKSNYKRLKKGYKNNNHFNKTNMNNGNDVSSIQENASFEELMCLLKRKYMEVLVDLDIKLSEKRDIIDNLINNFSNKDATISIDSCVYLLNNYVKGLDSYINKTVKVLESKNISNKKKIKLLIKEENCLEYFNIDNNNEFLEEEMKTSNEKIRKGKYSESVDEAIISSYKSEDTSVNNNNIKEEYKTDYVFLKEHFESKNYNSNNSDNSNNSVECISYRQSLKRNNDDKEINNKDNENKLIYDNYFKMTKLSTISNCSYNNNEHNNKNIVSKNTFNTYNTNNVNITNISSSSIKGNIKKSGEKNSNLISDKEKELGYNSNPKTINNSNNNKELRKIEANQNKILHIHGIQENITSLNIDNNKNSNVIIECCNCNCKNTVSSNNFISSDSILRNYIDEKFDYLNNKINDLYRLNSQINNKNIIDKIK